MSNIKKIGMVSFQIDPEGKVNFLDGQVKDVALTLAHNRSISSMNRENDEKTLDR